jgi:two-component system, cell cycle sensor histidine kinase and response regulator CckA
MNLSRAGGTVAATVLVAEDSEAVRELVRVALQGTGLRVLVAGSATEALEEAASRRVDVLVADVILPDGTGVDVATALRNDNPKLRVVYVSGWHGEPGFPDVGDDLLLAKPFTLEELHHAVTSMVGADGRPR